ncbi:MAG TPA: hypothetical protein VGO59_06675 [Verrucomicrobiae bacterium]
MLSIKFPFRIALAAWCLGSFVRCQADTCSLVPTADAFVATGIGANNLSGENFGAAGALTVESGSLPKGRFQTVIKFDLSAALAYFTAEYGAGAWAVQSISLQLSSTQTHPNAMFNAVAAGQFGVSLMRNNSWVEGTGTGGAPTANGITDDTLETSFINDATDVALGTNQFPGGITGTNTYELPTASGLASDVMGGSNLTLRLYPADTNISWLFNARSVAPGPTLFITAAPVTLAATLSGGNLLITWPANVPASFVLQQNSDLTSTNWTDVVTTNAQYQILISPTNSQEFFRLAAPGS